MPTERRPPANPKQLAAYLGLSVGTLKNWRSQQTGPPWTKVGRQVRYDWRAVDKWLASRTTTTY